MVLTDTTGLWVISSLIAFHSTTRTPATPHYPARAHANPYPRLPRGERIASKSGASRDRSSPSKIRFSYTPFLGLSWLLFDKSAGATAAARRTTRARASEHPSLHPASCPRRRSDRSTRPARRSRTAKTVPAGSACSVENLLMAPFTGETNVEFSGPDFVSPSAGRFTSKTSLTTPVVFLLVVFSPTPTHCGV